MVLGGEIILFLIMLEHLQYGLSSYLEEIEGNARAFGEILI